MPETLLRRMAAAVGVLYNASKRETCYKLPTDPNYDGCARTHEHERTYLPATPTRGDVMT